MITLLDQLPQRFGKETLVKIGDKFAVGHQSIQCRMHLEAIFNNAQDAIEFWEQEIYKTYAGLGYGHAADAAHDRAIRILQEF